MHYLGIDVGSIATKALVLDQDKNILGSAIVKTGGHMQNAIAAVFEEVYASAGISQKDVTIVSTGYGRKNVEARDRYVTEITAHHHGVQALFPKTRLIIDIGGQDTKVISVDENGEIEDFVMNDKCAAGTGRFLEVMAGILEVPLQDFGACALAAHKQITITSTCTVFAESEVISLISRQEAKEDIAYAIHSSVADRIVSLVRKLHVHGEVTLTGGVSKNSAIRSILEKRLNTTVNLPENPQIVGALGAAVIARRKSV